MGLREAVDKGPMGGLFSMMGRQGQLVGDEGFKFNVKYKKVLMWRELQEIKPLDIEGALTRSTLPLEFIALVCLVDGLLSRIRDSKFAGSCCSFMDLWSSVLCWRDYPSTSHNFAKNIEFLGSVKREMNQLKFRRMVQEQSDLELAGQSCSAKHHI